MAYTLLIVESPAKAKTIGRYLGDSYRISASIGHVRDLPPSTLGVNVKAGFKPRYVTMRGKESVVRELKAYAAEADSVIIATDPDREGEAIGWHLANILKLDEDAVCRVRFNEITKPAILKAVEQPDRINMDLVNAQQARRILDRLVGYELSPLLWDKVKRGTSAGRVQSVATSLIVAREEEIQNFKPEEYWMIAAEFLTEEQKSLLANYYGQRCEGKLKAQKLKTQAEAQAVLDAVEGKDFELSGLRRGEKKRNPYGPFTTSTLQQEASKRLNFSSSKTMRIAQQLYEGLEIQGQGQTSLVTYIRTDSMRVSAEAQAAAKAYILEHFGSEYLPPKPRFYGNKSQAQDAHEAIRPAHFDLPPSAVATSLDRDQLHLYELIWNRFMASQMASAVIDTLSLDIEANTHVFRATGEFLIFDGFLRVYKDLKRSEEDKRADGDADEAATDSSDQRLPEVHLHERLTAKEIKGQQKFTIPPPRYTEASLIKRMEALGIGRPSTYAPTIKTVMDRHYIEKDRRSLFPTDLGIRVTRFLTMHFPQIVSTDFTAKMEASLDQVESGEQDWIEMLDHFYQPFHERVEETRASAQELKAEAVKIGERCPECGGELIRREGRFGDFIGCENFPTCHYTRQILNYTGSHCPKCASPIVQMKSKRGRIFYVCDKSKDANCDFISWNEPVDGPPCPHCGSHLEKLSQYRGQQGKVTIQCSNPECVDHIKGRRKQKQAEKQDSVVAEASGVPEEELKAAVKKTKVIKSKAKTASRASSKKGATKATTKAAAKTSTKTSAKTAAKAGAKTAAKSERKASTQAQAEKKTQTVRSWAKSGEVDA